MSDPAPSERPELNQVQRWFQSVVTHPDGVEAGAASAEARQLIDAAPGDLEKIITRSKALSAAERMAVYANAYYTRLLECLGEVFPILKKTLGEDIFDGFAFGYLRQYPSRSYTLNHLGRNFARYLNETRPAPDSAGPGVDSAILDVNWPDFLIDLGNLEWVIYEVFDGPGVEKERLLQADDLLDIPAERWPEAHLEPVPCLRLLASRFPVNDYYSAMRKSTRDEPEPFPAPADCYLAVTRRDYVVRRYNLSRSQFELLGALQAGKSVGEAVQTAALVSDADLDELAADLQTWFRNWTAERFFLRIRCG